MEVPWSGSTFERNIQCQFTLNVFIREWRNCDIWSISFKITTKIYYRKYIRKTSGYFTKLIYSGPPLWSKWLHARLSRSGPGFDPQSGQVSWVRFFRGFSSPVRQLSGNFRPSRSSNIIWPSSSSFHLRFVGMTEGVLGVYYIYVYVYAVVAILWLETTAPIFRRPVSALYGHFQLSATTSFCGTNI